MRILAAIFDLNGTVVSDEDEWGEAFGKVLKSLGVEEDIPSYPHIGGIGVEENWPKLIEKYKIKTDKTKEELASLTKKEYFKLLDRVEAKDGFYEFLEELKESDIKVALATSSTRDSAEKLFDRFGLENIFDSITTGEEVENKKPDPDIFLAASHKLAIDPENCLVFEDSSSGIDAAHSAGMRVVGIYRGSEHKKTLEEADGLIKSFDEVTPEYLSKI